MSGGACSTAKAGPVGEPLEGLDGARLVRGDQVREPARQLLLDEPAGQRIATFQAQRAEDDRAAGAGRVALLDECPRPRSVELRLVLAVTHEVEDCPRWVRRQRRDDIQPHRGADDDHGDQAPGFHRQLLSQAVLSGGKWFRVDRADA